MQTMENSIENNNPCSRAIVSRGKTVIGIYRSAKRYNRAAAKAS